MKIYHGTDAEHVESILEEGLKPRNATGRSNWDHRDVESIPNHVYLTDKYAPVFGLQATDDSEFAMFEVDLEMLDDADLFPDEDFIEQAANMNPGSIKGTDLINEDESMEKRTQQVREYIGVFQAYWEDSLDLMGNISHRGTIPPEAISRVSIVEPPAELRGSIDPAMSIKHAQLVGGKYEMYTRLCMGDELTKREFIVQSMGVPDDQNIEEIFEDEDDMDRIMEAKEERAENLLDRDYIVSYQNPNYDAGE